MNLGVDDFPLKAIGVNIYGKMSSSPLLVAACPQIANLTVALLNEQHELRIKLAQEGPIMVAPAPNGLQWARPL